MLKKRKEKKNSHFVPMGFFSCLCVYNFVCAKEYLNNPLCTVDKSLVLNAVISSESSDLKKCICLLSDMYNLLQCKKQNSSFVSFLSCGYFSSNFCWIFQGHDSKGFSHSDNS